MRKRSLIRRTRCAVNILTPNGWLYVGTIVASAALAWSSLAMAVSS